MNTPLISVIIPYYNTEDFLKRCVDSITTQTYSHIEVILVDDGSEDSSSKIAHELAKEDNRIKIIETGHGGVSAARNAGLEAASGEYIMFVDSDDWMTATSIEHMQEVMADSGADLVTCEIVRSDGVVEEHRHVSVNAGKTEHTICSKDEYLRIFFKIGSNEWVHFPVAKLYKKYLLPKPLYPEGIRVGEDVLGTYLAVSNVQTVARMKEVGYFYYYNPESATGHFDESDFDLLDVWDRVVEASEGKEPDHEYAVLNRNRINFTLLFRMVTELTSTEIKKDHSEIQKQLLSDLKKSEKQLLASPIVKSRKIMIFMLCHFYPLVAFFGNLLVRTGRLFGFKTPVAQRRPLS